MWSAFDLVFFKVLGSVLILFGIIMAILFPSEDYEPKKRYIGFLFPLTLVLFGSYLLTIS